MALKLRDRFGGIAHLPRCHSLGCKRCDPFDSIAESLPERFRAGDTLVCIMAAGIPFRLLAPYLQSKRDDPAVIVLDEDGRHAVPLLGGHAAGANRFAREIADFLGGTAVITTSSDVQGLTAPDELAQKLGLTIDDNTALTDVTALLVDGRPVCIESREDPGVDGYGWVPSEGDAAGFAARVLITHNIIDITHDLPTARLIPQSTVAGIGCWRGAPSIEIIAAINAACFRHSVDPRSVGTIASIDVKRDEPGLAEAAAILGAKTIFYGAGELAALGRPGSDFVEEKVGTAAVCEPAAILAAGEGAELICGKEVEGAVTISLALRAHDFNGGREDRGGGQVLAVGTGAGTAALLTSAAREALREADVVMGYRTYIEQVRAIFPEKEFISGSMGAELDRCREAIELAKAGRTVALVSSGDAGVYGMAGPLLEAAGDTTVRIVPGVTSAQIAAARLGAPLMNDYITLSLSDLLTPREEVLRRARLAAASDMVVCLYNPISKKRRPLFEEVCLIMTIERSPDTPVGWVREAGSPAEAAGIISLAELRQQDIDMRTIVIIGNSQTEIINGRMITRRGYEKKRK